MARVALALVVVFAAVMTASAYKATVSAPWTDSSCSTKGAGWQEASTDIAENCIAAAGISTKTYCSGGKVTTSTYSNTGCTGTPTSTVSADNCLGALGIFSKTTCSAGFATVPSVFGLLLAVAAAAFTL